MDKQTNRALELLNRNPSQNILLIQRLKLGKGADIGIAGESLRLLDTGSGNYMFAGENWEEFETLYASAGEKPGIFFLSSDALLEPLKREHHPEAFEQWYVDKIYPEEPADPLFTFAPAEEEDLELVASTYPSQEFDRACLLRMIRNRPSVCPRQDGVLAGYMLTHEDGETGPMLVFDQYRRHGLGDQLIRRISNRLLAMGETPVGHIALENEISKKLHKRMGYEKCDGLVLWVYPKESIKES